MPFVIGQAMWAPAGVSEKVTLVCPICAGKRNVTVILGSGEQVCVPCEGCGIGYEGPRGVIEEWQHNPRAESFVIAELVSMHQDRWTVRSTSGAEHELKDLFATEAEALEAATVRATEVHDRNMDQRGYKRKALNKLAWAIRYHREKIAGYERQIGYHKKMINAGAKS